ncbi:MAG TPA: uracil-DNA glycosylase [Candidatus Pacebacteria bacterium]|nr:uracil-DNA glycosylase [Candidatus Paceibacterota bacterium]
MNKDKKLQKLNEDMDALCACALKKTALNVVPGKGSADAKVMFIGEAPGKKEDEKGEPFIGAAGKFLDELLASINLCREDIYITNVVKYRPPNNRDPLPEEVDDSWLWLQEQINLIDPVLIIPLGRHALERFVPGRKISEDHGRAFRREMDGVGKRVFYALYHPAAALYNGGLRDTLITDFAKIPRIVKAIEKDLKNN